jgi:hypothetical protein
VSKLTVDQKVTEDKLAAGRPVKCLCFNITQHVYFQGDVLSTLSNLETNKDVEGVLIQLIKLQEKSTSTM